MALSFALDLIGGQVFELLSESVARAVDRKAAFGELLQDMKYTLKSLKRQAIVIEQIQEYNLELSLPNDEMIALVTQMTEGRLLVDKLSGIRFRLCNFCCINDLANQLKELNSSLESLFDNLQLEQIRDAKETLKLSRQNRDDLEKMKVMLEKILQMIDDPEVKSLLKKLVEQNENGSMKSSTSTSTSTLGSGSCTETEGNCVTQVSSSKPLVEAAFRVLHNAVIEAKDSTIMFRPLLRRLKSTLDYLLPLMGEMVRCNKALDRPEEELENMRIQMENGVVLVGKCLNVRRRTRNKKYIYTNQLFDLNDYLQEQLSILLVQIARDVRETSMLIRHIKEVVKRDELSDIAENQSECKDCSCEPPLLTVELETNVQGKRDVIMETLVSGTNIEKEVKETEGRFMVGEVSETLWSTDGVEVLGMQGTKDVIKETQASTENTNLEVNQTERKAESQHDCIASLKSQQQTEGTSKVQGTLGHCNWEKSVSKETPSLDLPSPIPLEFNASKEANVFHDRPDECLDKEYETNRTVRKYNFKIHSSMCNELWNLVERISKIFPDIEAARSRCSSDVQALCMLNRAIEKTKQLIQHCSESSKLYLAFTGDVIVSRCYKARNLLEKTLCQIQGSVPVILVTEISKIVDDLKAATFKLDPSEEEAGKVVRQLLRGPSASNSVDDFELEAFLLASMRLHITSSKEVLIEKRSLKKLLQKVGDNDPKKKQILTYFLYLFRKYGNLMLEKLTESAPFWQQGSLASEDSGKALGYNQLAEPPEEYLCGISSRLMYDPVFIASGVTYERMRIQKWFDEGNDTCPKTSTKLAHLTLTPNVAMKELTSMWCAKYGVTIPNPDRERAAPSSWTNSSIARSSSMDDGVSTDLSTMSFGAFDDNFNSDTEDSLAQISDEYMKYLLVRICETDLEFLSNIDKLSWDSRCKTVQDVKNQLLCNPQASCAMSSENFFEPLTKFLSDAYYLHDVEAQIKGFRLLSAFVNKNRNEISSICKGAYRLLVSSLDSEVEEGLAIMQILSSHQDCRGNISSSGALAAILDLLDSQIRTVQGKAFEVLYNLSFDRDICSEMVSWECIPKLVPLFRDSALSGNCISILKNLCDSDRARIIAETDGCIASVVEVLEYGSKEHKEHAVDILLSLCSQNVDYCRLVMEERVIPGLVDSSTNGTERARINAMEVLRLLRDIDYVAEHEADADSANNSHAEKASKALTVSGENILTSSQPSIFTKKQRMKSAMLIKHTDNKDKRVGEQPLANDLLKY